MSDYNEHLPNMLHSWSQDKINTIVAAGMMSIPWTITYLQQVSNIAALFAPILGCIYLSMQIGFKLWDRTRNDE